MERAHQPLAPIFKSAPGIEDVFAARILSGAGDDPARFATAAVLAAVVQ